MTRLAAVATTPSSPALLLDEAVDSVSHVIVHPMVLLHVLDHHSRRQEATGRVIGTLLGRRDGRTVRGCLERNLEHCVDLVLTVLFIYVDLVNRLK